MNKSDIIEQIQRAYLALDKRGKVYMTDVHNYLSSRGINIRYGKLVRMIHKYELDDHKLDYHDWLAKIEFIESTLEDYKMQTYSRDDVYIFVSNRVNQRMLREVFDVAYAKVVMGKHIQIPMNKTTGMSLILSLRTLIGRVPTREEAWTQLKYMNSKLSKRTFNSWYAAV